MTDTPKNRLGFATRTIHAGQEHDPTTGAVMTPIYATSTYAQTSPGVHKGFEYARTQNPTRAALEKNVAAIEGGLGACACGSVRPSRRTSAVYAAHAVTASTARPVAAHRCPARSSTLSTSI